MKLARTDQVRFESDVSSARKVREGVSKFLSECFIILDQETLSSLFLCFVFSLRWKIVAHGLRSTGLKHIRTPIRPIRDRRRVFVKWARKSRGMTYAERSHLYILLEAIRENLRGAPAILAFSLSSRHPLCLLFIHTSISSLYLSILFGPSRASLFSRSVQAPRATRNHLTSPSADSCLFLSSLRPIRS